MLIPVFLEGWEGEELPNLRVCHMVMSLLCERHFVPLPFAKNGSELRQVIASLAIKGLSPGIYVANIFRGENLLHEADAQMGETPLLLLHREIHSYNLIARKSLHDTTALLRTLRPRLTVVCHYGTQNSHMVAERVALALLAFLKNDNFRHIELLGSGLFTSSSQAP